MLPILGSPVLSVKGPRPSWLPWRGVFVVIHLWNKVTDEDGITELLS